jgi:hypothetical protein
MTCIFYTYSLNKPGDDDCDEQVHQLCSEFYQRSVLCVANPTVFCLACASKQYPKGPCPSCAESKGVSRKNLCTICSVAVHVKTKCSNFNLVINGKIMEGYTCKPCVLLARAPAHESESEEEEQVSA